MKMQTVCPHCQSLYVVDFGLRGKPMRCPNPECRRIFEVRSTLDLPASVPPAPDAATPGPVPEPVADAGVMEEYPAAAAPTAAASSGGPGVDQLWTGGGPDDLWAWMSPEALPAAPPAPDTPSPAPATPPAESPPEPVAAAAEVYVCPRPFETGERLYGRERETAELTYLLVGERVVLLHSPSGAGKTSLLQAALVPAMTGEGFFIPHADPADAPPEQRGPRPIILRLNGPPEPGDPPGVNRYLLSVLLALEGHRPAAQRRPAAALERMTLDAYLAEAFEGAAAASAGHAADRPLLLFFDQFEEILTQDPTDEDAKLAFFRTLSKALTGPGRWALFAMREDYQPALEPYLKRIPPLFRATYRLDFLRQDKAVEAIRRPAWEAGEVDFVVAPDLVKDLMQVQVQQPDGTFKRKKGPSVEPVLLQVVCRRVWQMPRKNTRRIGTDVWPSDEPAAPPGEPPTPSSLPPQAAHLRRGVDNVLADYYAETVRQAAEAGEVSERLVRDWFRLKLIPGGIRQPVTLGDEARFGLTPGCIRVLDRAFLIRKEIQGGVYRYELAHDRLIRPVLQSNEAWRKENLNRFQLAAELWAQNPSPDLLVRREILQEGEQLARHRRQVLTRQEQEFLRACQEARRTRRHRRNFLLVVLACALAVGGLALYLWYDHVAQTARHQQKVAELRKRKNAELFAVFSLAQHRLYNVSGQSFLDPRIARVEDIEAVPFSPPENDELVEVALKFDAEAAPKPDKPGDGVRVIALGAINALERRAMTAREVAELDQIHRALAHIVEGANDRRVRAAARAAAGLALERRPLLQSLARNAKVIFQLGSLKQFGLSGVGPDGALHKLTDSPQGYTSRTIVSINGQGVIFGSNSGTWDTDKKRASPGKGPDGKDERLAVRSTWGYSPASVRVTQILEIVRSDNQALDTCLVGYVLENWHAKETYRVGLTAVLDTNIDGNDRNPFAVRGRVIQKPEGFEGPKVPDYVRALREPSLQAPGYDAYFSFFPGQDVDRPDWFLIDNLWVMAMNLYPPERCPAPSSMQALKDSAVCIHWAAKALPPGRCRVLAYAFGRGRVSPQTLREQRPLILERAQKCR